MTQLEEVVVKCPKELNDIRNAIVAIVEDVKSGKDLVVIAGENLQGLSDAISGLEKVPNELKDALAESVSCLGVMAGEIVGILAKPKQVPASA